MTGTADNLYVAKQHLANAERATLAAEELGHLTLAAEAIRCAIVEAKRAGAEEVGGKQTRLPIAE